MLVSVHLPKTAGTSFREALSESYGTRLYTDYNDRPVNTPLLSLRLRTVCSAVTLPFNSPVLTGSFDCVHGHFLPFKYCALGVTASPQFITWLRDPLDRLLSHYFYWRDASLSSNFGPVWQQFRDESWSLERFCSEPVMRNLYARFLWGFPLRHFDFVGLTEHYEADLEFLGNHVLQRNLKLVRRNIMSGTGKREAKDALSARFIENVRGWHSKDYRIYEQALEMRARRIRLGSGKD
ncbi:hypothetical protein FV139_16545 [Parahaliea maris]|uniref:Sulfotransferase family protein n=1 Tax=Parahaliea maris TaxID=2716870 RepID=A0A5C8ZU57_9GAMM|nr:sulfotransferase family 2 domain-containing protein [Parahaliea maris]TXS91339.1 hypothetical protein FV139_16545 [Parahaliea maris]